MGCYAVPLAAVIIHFFMRRKNPSMRISKHHTWLNRLFIGGAIFGVVDHAWNGELFMISDALLLDLALGATITAVILAAWGIMVWQDKLASRTAERAGN
ncbi:hypothetical protein KY362_06640 [Candidatus Woesearchaeota archaeon]|nr:hypothetical protein [Candidatus Woesearchaeota archaeon]